MNKKFLSVGGLVFEQKKIIRFSSKAPAYRQPPHHDELIKLVSVIRAPDRIRDKSNNGHNGQIVTLLREKMKFDDPGFVSKQ